MACTSAWRCWRWCWAKPDASTSLRRLLSLTAWTARAAEIDSLLCVGLDPRGNQRGRHSRGVRRASIDATADSALAFKPNSAFFEAFGPEGMLALMDVIATVPDGIPVILDAKRGDIANTAEAYARAAFQTLGAHAITAQPLPGPRRARAVHRQAGERRVCAVQDLQPRRR